jgi:hypothetical protein
MALAQYIAEVKDGLLLELPEEAEELHLKPGDKVQIQLDRVVPDAPRLPKGKKLVAAPNRVSAMGKYAGILSSEELMRRKQKDIALENLKLIS